MQRTSISEKEYRSQQNRQHVSNACPKGSAFDPQLQHDKKEIVKDNVRNSCQYRENQT